MSDQDITDWLAKIGLGEYKDTFLANGYDHPSALPDLDESDLDAMNITKPGHRKRLLVHAKKAGTSTSTPPATTSDNSTSSDKPAPKPRPKPTPRPRPPSEVAPARDEGGDSKEVDSDVTYQNTPTAVTTTSSLQTGSDVISVAITNETSGAITTIQIPKVGRPDDALSAFVKATNASMQDGHQWLLYEVFETPPVERRIQDSETILEVQSRWPPAGSPRLVARQVPDDKLSQGKAELSGKMDKRGGSHKNWKSRFFILRDTGIAYYSKSPSKQKDIDSPAGIFQFVNSLIYTVRHYKKSPRPSLCFCIRHIEEPMWPSTDAVKLQEEFENGCKFMCATSEEQRDEWIASILAAQQALIDRGEVYGQAGAPPVPKDVEEDEDDTEKSPEDSEQPAESEEFVPIAPKPVRGVGFGNVMVDIKPKRSSIVED